MDARGRLNRFNPAITHAIEKELVQLSARIDAATHRQLYLIREADQIGFDELWGFPSLANYLSHRIGMSPGVARERIRVARALGRLPKIDEAFSKGLLSFSKVRAVTRVATPENEADMLNLAEQCSAAELERVIRGLRKIQSQEMPETKPTERYVRTRDNEDGTSTMSIRMMPDEAAKVYECLQRVRAVLREETDDKPDLVDAVVRIADMVAAGDLASDVPAGTRKQVTGGDTADVVIHLEAGMLSEELDAKLEDGSRVPAETFRRVACDCGVHAVVEGEDGIVGVGRKTRSIPPAVRRALRSRDVGCRYPGCTCRRYVQAHHIEHWVEGGATNLSNLVSLCPFHHRLLHEGGFSVACSDEAGFEFRTPRGEVVAQREARVPAETPLEEEFVDLPTDTNMDANLGRMRTRRFELVEIVNNMASCVLTPEAELERARKELEALKEE